MFKSLYRKYRPKSFDDVVGQKNIVSILQNAIKLNKISHSYLFYGPRGTGKTSLAKIFANEVNENKEYLSDSVDIIEIDAASNNGVDEIRDIKEAIKFTPNDSKYKVYIIDEVHMLSISAFNALLKTLEEPPSHIIFILATTEMHKIPSTILSRCQKFEFKNLKTEEIFDRLKYISNKENINIEEEALYKICNLSNGGLRDAIGILEQASNCNKDKVTLKDILELTSSLDDEFLLEFYKSIIDNNTEKCLEQYKKLVEEGINTKNLISNLINLSKDILLYKNLKNNKLDNKLLSMIETLEKLSYERIYDIVEILSETETKLRFSTEHISYMQICIIKLTNTENKKTEKEIILEKDKNIKIENLEKKILELEKKIENILLKKNENINNEKINDYIIPNKKEIIKIINNSDDKFLNYAKMIFNKILNKYLTGEKELFNLLKDSEFLYSSKEGCILTLNDDKDVFKILSNNSYKNILENYFYKYIGVKYTVHILQKSQYNYFIENQKVLEKEEQYNINNQEKNKNKSKSKIEEIFSDIITEK